MENRYFSNNAVTSIVSDNGNTITVNSTATFPSLYPFLVTLETPSLVKEIVKVTGSPSANIWTVVRAQEGTTTITFPVNTKVEQRITAGTLTSLVNEKADLVGATFTGTVKVKTETNTGISLDKTGSGSLKFENSSNSTTSTISMIPSSKTLEIVLEGPVAQNTFSVKTTSGSVGSQTLDFTSTTTGKGQLKIGNRLVPGKMTYGDVLPTEDLGPIWHDSYNSWLTWQTFDQNGASYTGYASVNIGQLILDSQSTERTGRIKVGRNNLSKTTYAALWNWALHNNLVVSNWAQGMWAFKDNNDGTFRVPDTRGIFIRMFDDGAGIDTSRTSFTTYEADTVGPHTHSVSVTTSQTGSTSIVPLVVQTNSTATLMTGGVDTVSTETKPKNIAQLGTIQF